jgi:hypothetical protein
MENNKKWCCKPLGVWKITNKWSCIPLGVRKKQTNGAVFLCAYGK